MTSIDFRRHSRRSKSLSYSDPISDDPSVVTAATSIPSTPLRYLGIPFSWEQFPGIPKKNTYKKLHESSQNLLPPPPSSNKSPTTTMIKKNKSSQNFKKDPFFAAFVECSKDNNDNNNNEELESKFPISGDRSGFVVSMYSSCKRSCSVSESIVFRRRSPADYL